MSYADLRNIKLRYKSVYLGFVLFLFLFGFANSGMAATSLSIYKDVSDPSLSLDSYGTALFYINVTDIPIASDTNPNGLAAFQIKINFDPTKIKIEDPNAAYVAFGISPFAPLLGHPFCGTVRGTGITCPDPAWFLTSTGRQPQTSSQATFVDNTNGILSIAYGTTGTQMPPTGSGVIALFKVTALTDLGTASLIFEEATAGDNSEPIERYTFTIGDSTINIGTACTPAAETCNDLDDDCDGLVDEDFADIGDLCGVGLGACAATGMMVCSANQSGTVCNAAPGIPSEEVCDGIDNDCDETVDDNVILNGGDACTIGACVGGVEVYTPISVDDGDACTIDACDPVEGESHIAVNADDGDACTADSCDPQIGVIHTAVNVDDQDVCTIDSCDPAVGAVHTPVNSDDQDACTVDSCDPVAGAQHAAVNPDDGNACTTDSCDPATGVLNDPVNTDDQNVCTIDSCDPAVGAVHTF